ncbi:MAG: hypothetical protein AAB648_02150 [Patescibacteria group bacterium]
MAQEQVINQNLVLDGGKEKLAKRINGVKLHQIEKKFFRYFKLLSESFFGLSEEQLRKISIEELIVLDELISYKALPWAISQVIFSFVPLIGWMSLLSDFEYGCYRSLHYLYHRKYLKKVHGKNFLPEILKYLIKTKTEEETP